MKKAFLSFIVLIISISLTKAQVNSSVYNSVKNSTSFTINTINNNSKVVLFSDAMTQLYNYNKSLGNYQDMPSLSTILANSTYTSNGIVYFNDLDRATAIIKRRISDPNREILLATITKYRGILAGATDYNSFKTLISTEIGSTSNQFQKDFYNSILASGDILETNQSTISTNLGVDRLAGCKGWWQCWGKCTFGILGGALFGGLEGASAGSAVPVVGTVGGGVIGVISGGIGGAIAGCNLVKPATKPTKILIRIPQ